MIRFNQLGIRSYLKLFSHVTAGIITLILLCSGTFIITYAQVSLKPDPPVINNSNSTASQPQQQSHEVKITSPTKGQHVQAGKGLVITGTSTYDSTSGCQVSVIVNGIKPYQNTTPSGLSHDYSKWSFILTSKYTPIKEGQNKITAKFSCGKDPGSVSHNSVNVTGVLTNITTSIVNTNQLQKHQNQQSSSMQTTRSGTNFTAANTTSAKNSIPALINTSYYDGQKNNTIRALSASVHVGKSTIHLGDKQTITIKVTDTNSTNAIAGAKVTGSIMDPSGSSKKSSDGITDNTGEYTYSWAVGHNDATGSYKVEAQVSSFGYVNDTASKSFKVISTPVSSSNINVQSNSGNGDTNNKSNKNDNNHNHPSTIITILHIRVPQIRIPFHLPFH